MRISEFVANSATTCSSQGEPAFGWKQENHISVACEAYHLMNDIRNGFVDWQVFEQAHDTKQKQGDEKQNVSLERLNQGGRQAGGVIDNLQAHQVFSDAATLVRIIASQQHQHHDQLLRYELHRKKPVDNNQYRANHHAQGKNQNDI